LLAFRIAVIGLILAGQVGPAPGMQSAHSADELLRLVPPDATVVITLEGLRDVAQSARAARLLADLRDLPAVRRWLDSQKYQNLERSCAHIERILGVRLAELRDELLGDAVVLVVRVAPEAAPDPSQARGLLLLRARSPGLLERLVRAINKVQEQSGELGGVASRTHGGTEYQVREFPPGSGRLPEWYATFADGTFAFSNSEALIQSVIDLKNRAAAPVGGGATDRAGNPEARAAGVRELRLALGEKRSFKAVAARLPSPALARLFVDPRALGRMLSAAPPPRKPDDLRMMALLERYVAAVDYAGAALVWSDDTLAIHTVETLDPSRIDSWLRRWAGDSRSRDADLGRVPPTALAIASTRVDFLALRDVLYQIVPEAAHNRLRNLETLASGMLLGQDLADRVLPRLGPGVVAYLDSPLSADGNDASEAPAAGKARWFPVVAVIGLSEGGQPAGGRSGAEPRVRSSVAGPSDVALAAALENLMRTLLAAAALDEKLGQGRSRIVTMKIAGGTVTTLDAPGAFAYGFDARASRLVLGNSAAAVARYLESAPDFRAARRFQDFEARAPRAGMFAYVDLQAATSVASQFRERLAEALAIRQKRSATEVARDLDDVIASARLLRGAFVASHVEPDASAVKRCVGLILRPQEPTSPRPQE
jgi:hypothetical protein